MKVAKLVYVTFLTRVIVEDTDTDEQIVSVAKKGIQAQMDNDEVFENLDKIEDDKECPFGTLQTDKNDNDPIKYTEAITKVEFDEFREVLKELDPQAYEDEAKDNFVDCYAYWVGLGWRRFKDKHTSNIERLKLKKA